MKHLSMAIIILGVLLFSCTHEPMLEENPLELENEIKAEAPLEDPAPVPMKNHSSKWSKPTHTNVMAVCASQWGLSSARSAQMAAASEMPDVYQSGIENAYNQQWSHAYLYTIWGIQIWGDADDDCHDNIDGDSGESESPEGYNGKWAGYYYNQGNQSMGDWYVGYAGHFMQDVGLVLHSSLPSLAMLTHHFDYEAWVNNNLTQGHNFLAMVSADYNYYPVTDLKQGIKNCAYGSSYSNSDLGENSWDAYVDSGYPTGTGTGSSALVNYTGQMLVRAARFTKGMIKYALDKYGQWNSNY
ncbi:MAG: hypothetical protein JXR70_12260 [Spirochaetales bacterium]|nr:hypothetical protein [Spirochaetales bacterium]